MKMIATKRFRYAGAQVEAGNSFEVRDRRDAHILRVIGRAVDNASEFRPVAALEQAPIEGEPEFRTKRKYKRRDLEAE